MASTDSVYSRKNPFHAALAVNRKLTGEGSQKETRHFELSLAGSGLKYEVGDSLGVFPLNNPELVEFVLHELGFTGNEVVPSADAVEMPIREALMKSYILTEPSKQLLQAVATLDPSAAYLEKFLLPEEKAALENYLWGLDVLDVLQQFPAAKLMPAEFIKVLRKLQPRLYSIASSQKAVGESVHLTIALVRYGVKHSPRQREGVCSTYLTDRTSGSAPVFVHTAKHFRMPENSDTPMIMVGPGTGIAPFRAFLQERKATGANGKNWLFFGDQRAATDFLYQEELEVALADGSLHKLDTAFSRDQEHKIYVQHRMHERGAELFDWLESGAYFYVCGDAKRMAKDVDAALHAIVEKHGAKSPEQSKDYVEALKKEKRYRKDVY